MSWQAGAFGALLFLGGCSGCEGRDPEPGGAGAEAQGNAGGGAGGASGGGAAAQGGDAAATGADGGASEYRVSIEASRVEVCAGECVELTAHAEHGRAPYRYVWTDEIGEGAGPHEVCPAETTAYSVVAHDTGTEGGELAQPSREALASVQITVDDDGSCESEVDGGVMEPPSTGVLCSVRVPFESPALFYSLNSWSGYAGLAVDSEGSVYLLGMFEGSIDLGAQTISATGANAVVLKYDASCQLVWAKVLGESDGEMYLNSIAVSGDGELVVGGHLNGAGLSAALIMKLSASDATVLWTESFSGLISGAMVLDLGIDDAGDITLSGSAGGETSFGGLPIGDSNDMMSFVAKLSGSGEHLYSFGVEDDDTRAPLAVHASGSVAIAGRGDADGFRVGEERYLFADDPQQSYVSIHDSTGARQWLGQLGAGNEGEWTGAMAIDRDGDIVLERLVTRPDDVAGEPRLFAELLKMGADGLIDWSQRSHGGRVVDPFMPGGLAVDSQRAIIEVYQLQRSSIHVEKHTPEGEPVWSFTVEDNVTAVWGVATAPDDAVWLAYGENTELVITKLRP